jgi:photosystem II stability/assembly factor-like uncharacterized protein
MKGEGGLFMKLLSQFMFMIIIIITLLTTNVANAQWVQTNGPDAEVTYSLATGVNPEGDTILFAGTYSGGIFSTNDYGDNWKTLDRVEGNPGDTGITRQDIRLLAAAPNKKGGICLFAVDAKGNLFHSINSDTNWEKINSNIGNYPVLSIAVFDTDIFVGADSSLYRSNDLGNTWTRFYNELTSYGVNSFAGVRTDSNKTELFACTNGGILFSSNNGENWVEMNSNIRYYYNLVANRNAKGQTILYAINGVSTGYQIYRSTNNGVDWTEFDNGLSGGGNAVTLATHDSIVYAGTSASEVFYISNKDTNWIRGGNVPTNMLLSAGPYLFSAGSMIGTQASVWRRPLSELLTEIRSEKDWGSFNLILEQNYPNPFNPTTVIEYSLLMRSKVTLYVFDILGRKVATLVNRNQTAGTRSVTFDANNLASGVYFYQLRAGSFTATKKLLLLK